MAAANNLFNDDISLLRSTAYFGANVIWAQVSASVARAEKTYLRSIFGSYYTDLLTKIGEDTLDSDDQALLNELRLASANLTWWLYAPKHNVNISSTGFQQTHGENEKPAFQWAVGDVKNSFRDAGFEAIENTFEFLEINAGTYQYEASSVRKAAKGLILSSVADFEEFVDIVKSRYLYQRIIPEMKRIQNDVVAPIIGADAFSTLIKKLQKDNGEEANANDLSESETAQLVIIKPLIAYMTTAEILQNKSVIINENGVLVHNSTYAGTIDGTQSAQLDRIKSLFNRWMDKAQGKINALDELVNPQVDKTADELESENLLNPDDSLGGFL